MKCKKLVSLLLMLLVVGGPLIAETSSASGAAASPLIDQERLQRLVDVDAVSAASSSWQGGAPNYRLHRTLGYLTMGGVVATGLLGWLAPGDVHSGVAIGTTGMAAVTTGMAVAYLARGGSLPVGHVVLTGLGTLGFAANLFIEPGESDDDDDEDGSEESGENSNLHSILGAASVGAFALGVAWVIAY